MAAAAIPYFVGCIMGKIIIDAAALDALAQEIEHNAFMLGYIYDADDVDEVAIYADRLKRAAAAARGMIKKSKPYQENNQAAPVPGEQINNQ